MFQAILDVLTNLLSRSSSLSPASLHTGFSHPHPPFSTPSELRHHVPRYSPHDRARPPLLPPPHQSSTHHHPCSVHIVIASLPRTLQTTSALISLRKTGPPLTEPGNVLQCLDAFASSSNFTTIQSLPASPRHCHLVFLRPVADFCPLCFLLLE